MYMKIMATVAVATMIVIAVELAMIVGALKPLYAITFPVALPSPPPHEGSPLSPEEDLKWRSKRL